MGIINVVTGLGVAALEGVGNINDKGDKVWREIAHIRRLKKIVQEWDSYSPDKKLELVDLRREATNHNKIRAKEEPFCHAWWNLYYATDLHYDNWHNPTVAAAYARIMLNYGISIEALRKKVFCGSNMPWEFWDQITVTINIP